LRTTLALLVVSLVSVGCGARDEAAQPVSEPIARSGPIAVYEAFAPAPILIESAALYFTLRNDGAEPDTLLSVSVDVADSATLHTQVSLGAGGEGGRGGSMRMAPLEYLVVPAGGAALLVPGGHHVMLTALHVKFEEGDTIHAEVTLARAGTISFPVPVLSYADVADRVERRSPEGQHRD